MDIIEIQYDWRSTNQLQNSLSYKANPRAMTKGGVSFEADNLVVI
jgi:hypothetical protein